MPDMPAEKYLREVWPAVTRTLKEHGVGCELNLVGGERWGDVPTHDGRASKILITFGGRSIAQYGWSGC